MIHSAAINDMETVLEELQRFLREQRVLRENERILSDNFSAHTDGGVAENEEQRWVDALNRLKNLPVTPQLLSSTQVSRLFGKLKNHHSNRIQTVAYNLFHYWKKNVMLEANSSFPSSNDPSRDEVRQLLLEALRKVYTDSSRIEELMFRSNAGSVAAAVESILHEKWGAKDGPHRAQYRSLFFNLRDAQNTDFRMKVILGQVKPETLPTMNILEMASHERQMENKKMEEKAMIKCVKTESSKTGSWLHTDRFECARCGERKSKYENILTTIGDETARCGERKSKYENILTTIGDETALMSVICLNCDNHWYRR